MLSRGEAAGVFQFESPGMVDTLRKLKPRRIQDLIAVSALYRPGPMENIPTYIRRHHGDEEVAYPEFPVAEPILTPILEETYGIPVYQEQIMQIAQAVAGYSLGEADILRRAMGKKKLEEMEKQRRVFEEGAGRNAIPKREANGIFDLLEKFANYGFNKSHSAAYGVLSYQTAYIRAHYPVEFFAALLTVERGNSDKVAQYASDSRKTGIDVLPPDINQSRDDFTPVEGVVRFGLYGIKNVGDNAVEHILRERDKSGAFKDLHDFCKRIDSSLVNKRALEHLIKSGAFDALGERHILLANVEQTMKWGAAQRQQAETGQTNLFAAEEVKPQILETAAPLSELELLKLEKDALGLYISSHPMSSYPGLAEAASCAVNGLESWYEAHRSEAVEGPYGGRVKIALGGILQNVVKKPTKKGTMMAKFDIADETGNREVVAFSRTYDQIADLLRNEAPVVLIAELSDDDGGIRIVADRLIRWDLKQGLPEVAVLDFELNALSTQQLIELRSYLDELTGITPVRLRMNTPAGRVTYDTDGICVNKDKLEELRTSCPWLGGATLTVATEKLLRVKQEEGFYRRGGDNNPPPAEVPF